MTRADQRLAAYAMISLEDAAAETWVTERFLFVLVALFGALGLLLACIGVYGLLALQVARRTREFGVRFALGATASAIIRMVATQGALGTVFLAYTVFASNPLMRLAKPPVEGRSLNPLLQDPALAIHPPANTFTPDATRSPSTLTGLLGLPMRAKKRGWLVYCERAMISSKT